jgi:hypothetical protein
MILSPIIEYAIEAEVWQFSSKKDNEGLTKQLSSESEFELRVK